MKWDCNRKGRGRKMDLLYSSTRNSEKKFTASQAILKGLADDGGLFVPESIPALDVSIEELSKMSYQETAYAVMKKFLTDFTEEEKTNWSENGDDKHTDNYTNDETTKVKGNNKEDSERNLTTNVKTGNTHTEQSVTGEKTNEIFTGKGRKGANPSELIMKYRESLLNIDMMIVGELETLFMGVY